MELLSRLLRATCLGMLAALPAPAAMAFPSELAAVGGNADDGAIVERRACRFAFDNYEAWLAFIRDRRSARGESLDEAGFRATYPAANFARLRDGSIECWAILYRSDGLNVSAYLVHPRRLDDRPLPAIIYNRGGNRDYGRLVFADLVDLAGWAAQGFAVLASQYRGGADGEGADEFGGADIDDVLNLFPVALALGVVDMSNVFMAGFSRGGLMTYLALARGAPVKAAAVIGGPTDLERLLQARPEMLELYRELMPDFELRRVQHLQARRAVDFAHRFTLPLLLLHGGADERVPAEQALEMAQQLQRSRGRYELVIYADDDHTLTRNAEDSRRRISDWFRRHLR